MIHIVFVNIFLYSHRTLWFQDTVFGYKKGLKIEFNNIYHVRWFSFVFESITLIMELVNWPGKEPTNEARFCSILYFIHRIVRKFGQNRDFVKFHPALRNWVLNISKNGLQGVERTLWTSSRSNMKVRRPKSTKPPTLLPISWFWVIFWRIFCKIGFVGNKRSTFVD